MLLFAGLFNLLLNCGLRGRRFVKLRLDRPAFLKHYRCAEEFMALSGFRFKSFGRSLKRGAGRLSSFRGLYAFLFSLCDQSALCYGSLFCRVTILKGRGTCFPTLGKPVHRFFNRERPFTETKRADQIEPGVSHRSARFLFIGDCLSAASVRPLAAASWLLATASCAWNPA